MESYSLSPIGYLSCDQYYRYQQPRQGVFSDGEGVIKLNSGEEFKLALRDLEGFSHIWLIYIFHLNAEWAPLVNPPVNPDGKRKGVFATRSPHRPNRLGLSVVELCECNPNEGTLTIKKFDLLDKTPIVDIKPYIVGADSHPEAKTGWLPKDSDQWNLYFTDLFKEQSLWIKEKTSYDIGQFCSIQLCHDPLNNKRKRVKLESNDCYVIAFRTWRIRFFIKDDRSIVVDSIFSGYSKFELLNGDDPYNDKEIHQSFIEIFAL